MEFAMVDLVILYPIFCSQMIASSLLEVIERV
jgi:hypothetical protein